VRVIAATHQDLEERVKQGFFREDLFHRLNVIRLRLPALRERREDVPDLARAFLQKSAKELGVEAKRLSNNAMARLMAFNFPGNVRQLENICHWLTVMAPAQIVDAKDLPPELMVAAPLHDPVTSAIISHTNTSPLEPIPAYVAPITHEPLAAESITSSSTNVAASTGHSDWLTGLADEASALLLSGQADVWDTLSRKFESCLIEAALQQTRGRRIEAALKLGIGRNTITRKIQELNIDN